jgi:hypothetical protein
MAQASGGEHPVGRFALRTIATIVGLIGAMLALIITVLYSVAHVLTAIAGVPHDGAHFLGGLLVVLIGAVGAFVAPLLPILAAVMLIIAGIGFFFAVGWWAIIASVFFLVAAVLTFSNRRVDIPGTA